MSKLDALRKLIREEMRQVIREELPKLLIESKGTAKYSDTFKPKAKDEPPLTLNTHRERRIAPPIVTGNSMLNSLLNETAATMTPTDEVHVSTMDVDGYALMQQSVDESAGVGGVQDMLQSAAPSSAVEMVQINQVPDFSELMDKMMKKGVM